MQDIILALPEIFLLSMTCVILLVGLYTDKTRNVTYALSQLTLVITGLLTARLIGTEPSLTFSGQGIVDPMGQTLKIFILSAMFVALFYGRTYVQERAMARAEYHLLALFATLGMMILVSSNTTLMLYLGLELFSLPVYTLVALNRDSAASVEAGMKYFITGALASGMLLYGISILYGVTGHLDFSGISESMLQMQDIDITLLTFGLIFIIAGIAFKFGAVPFHMWLPDVYDGAPSSVTLMIATAPKIAAFGMTYRLLYETMPFLLPEWSHFLILLSVLSLALGNIVAIAQTNIKRMLAYSTIAHVGFVFLGFLTGSLEGLQAAMFYVIVYAFVSACAFGVVIFLSHKGFEAENISDFKGLGQRNPWIAFLMLLTLFSLTGVPPTVGFYAKFLILNALVGAHLTELAVIAVIFSIIGAFYYIRLIKVMYFDSPELPTQTAPRDMQWVLSLNGLAVLALGIFPGPLWLFCQQAMG